MEGNKDSEMRVVRPVILLLENDSNDVFLFRRALARLGYRGTVRTVTGLSEARSYLEGTGSYADHEYNPRPDLIVCDMALIGSTGNDFLEWFREQPPFREIPVVMLSGSALPTERTRAAELGARAFYQKTGDIAELTVRVGDALKHLPAGH